MLKLVLRIILLTIVLEGAALMFMDEFILTMLVILTVGLVSVRVMLGMDERRASGVRTRSIQPIGFAASRERSASGLRTTP